jgi:hypothetical protein
MINDMRTDGCDAFVQALRTGEASAVRRLEPLLAPGVVFRAGSTEIAGADAVAARLSGAWPLTPVFAQGVWSAAEDVAEGVRITGTFASVGAAPKSYALTFGFDAADRIVRVDETVTPFPPATPSDQIPAAVRAAINGALANGTPMVVGYVGEDGAPVLSLRGSVQVYGPAALCLWARNPKSGLVTAARNGQPLSLLYRNSAKRITLGIRGHGEVADDAPTRERVFALSPEVEQRHDLARNGAAVVVRIDRLQGMTPDGPVLVVAPRAPQSP